MFHFFRDPLIPIIAMSFGKLDKNDLFSSNLYPSEQIKTLEADAFECFQVHYVKLFLVSHLETFYLNLKKLLNLL